MHRREGTRAYFKAETKSPVFRDLQQLFEKTARLAPTIERMLAPLGGNIQCAFVYGSVARSREHATSDVDLIVIGKAGLADLSPVLRKAEASWEERSTSQPIPQRSSGKESKHATISSPPFYENGNSL